jgi:hypothetical protein
MRITAKHVFISAASLLLSSTAFADRCKSFDIETESRLPGIEIDFELFQNDQLVTTSKSKTPPILQVGSTVDMCFSSSHAGLISLWSYPADGGPPSRLLPHKSIDAPSTQTGMKVEAGKRYCMSELLDSSTANASDAKRVIRVKTPTGTANAYLHYTTTEEYQFAATDFPTIGSKTYDLSARDCEGKDTRQAQPVDPSAAYASAHFEYKVQK